jgi:pyruvate dehydrogenase E1 component
MGGMQNYPSRTKDKILVDFPTGSVGLGVAITAFASLALMGDAELDERNIYECQIAPDC